MAFVITHPDYGLYLGSNQDTQHWTSLWRADHPPAVQCFETLEDAIKHVSGWPHGNVPSLYNYLPINDGGSGYVFEDEAIAQGFPGWSDARSGRVRMTLP